MTSGAYRILLPHVLHVLDALLHPSNQSDERNVILLDEHLCFERRFVGWDDQRETIEKSLD